MAKTAGTLLTNVLSRVRDPSATGLATNSTDTTASGNTFGFFLLTQAQYFINSATMNIISSASLTLSAATTLYPVFSNLANCIKVTAVQLYGLRDLYRADWKSFGRADRKWLIKTGSEVRNWAPIGNDLIALVPALDVINLKNAGTATVQYIKLTTAVTASGNTFDLPDDLLGLVETLATALACLKTKQLADFQNMMTRLTNNLQPITIWNLEDTNKAV